MMELEAVKSKAFSKKVFYAVLFSVFIFAYMVVLSVTDSFAGSVPELAGSLFLHYLPAFTRILGYLSFALSRRFIKTENRRRLVLAFASLIFLLSSLVLIGFSDATSVSIPGQAMIAALFVLSLSIGHLGGLVYYVTSSALVTDPHRGAFIGGSCTAAVLVQFILSPLMGDVIQLVTVTILFLLISWLEIRPPADYVLEDALPYAGDDKDFMARVKGQITAAMLVVLLCTIIACRIDVAFSTLSFSGDLNLYSFPRLFIIPGYLIMGFMADAKDRRLFPAVFFAGVLSTVTLIAMPFYDSGYYFFLSAYYFFIGFYVFYYTYTFMALAPRTKHPELWASFGRPLSDLFSGIFIMLLISTNGWAMKPLVIVFAHFVLLCATGFVIMLGKIDPALTPEDRKAEEAPDRVDATVEVKADQAADTEGDSVTTDEKKGGKKHALLETEDRLDAFLDTQPLTPREREVSKYLIETELTMKEIAANLFISERSAYRYSSSIYEKTGVTGRKELLRKYLEG